MPRDLRTALAMLRRRPLFSAVTIGTLALGIAANATIFALVEATVLRRPPYPDPDRVVVVHEVSKSGRDMQASWPTFQDWQRSGAFAAAGAYSGYTTTVLGGARPQRLPAMAVSAGFFEALGVEPAVGRVPTAAEHQTPVAVVSHAFWRDSLGGGALAGKKLEIEGHSFAVLGVMPAGFDFPDGAQVWVPLELMGPSPYRTAHNHKVIARLLPGARLEQVESQLAALTRRVAHDGPDPAEASDYLPIGAGVRRLQVERALPVRGALFLLLGAAGFVLLVACSNLASTFLARGLERQRELAVRRALGASRKQLVRQLVVEASVLAAAGCLAGLLLAATLGRAAVAAAPPVVASAAMRLDAPVWLYTVALAAIAALLASLAPSLVATATPAGSLRGGRSEGISPGQRRTWSALIAVQAGLALLLLAGAGLLLRSFAGLLAVTPGFEPAGVATLQVSPPVGGVAASPPASGYPDDAAVARFQERLVGALAASPGIAAAGVISYPPFGEFDPTGQMRARSGRRADASYRVASGGYFDAVRIPLVAGRLFDARDDSSHPHAAIVDRAAAELFWPGEDPLGQQISSEGMDEFGRKPEWATVVGVVGSVRQSDLAGPPDPTVYFAMAQRPRRDAVVVARGRGAAGELLPLLQRTLERVAPDVPGGVGLLADAVAKSRAQRRFALLLIGTFASLTLLLAALGVYGVVAYAVARRTRELGVRLALGAAPRQAQRLVLRGALAPVSTGIVLALLAAAPLTRGLRALLFEVKPWDPASWLLAAAVLGGAALLAGWLPARRATRIDPQLALRSE